MQFEEQNYNRTYNTTPKGISGWLINKGMVKDIRTANRYLIVVAIVSIAIAIFLVWPESRGPELTPTEVNEAGSLSEITNS